METLTDQNSVHPSEITKPLLKKTTHEEGIPSTSNYAVALKPPTILSPCANRYGNPEVKARFSIHNGMPAVIFRTSDYYGVMAEEWRLTIVGKFLRTRPQMEKIRSKFVEKITVKGNVKIGVYDYRTVILDFSNEDEWKSVWYRISIEIEGQLMWLEKWTPNFKPEEDSPVVPVWVLLSELPFHCHTWHYVKKIVSPIGAPLSMDLATDHKTRPSIAKVRVEVDLTKPKLTLLENSPMATQGKPFQ
ncbi:hypothetical protein A4A49_02340 [Nicotiana attenuata]|uniref:DUF4283 domain-containing protein n=1 Tax=Nicotiana attenuata TaxID=49451 RepID=A0A1J6I0P0_NICAT|nr:hypothetical protein A4A49_02340 [Nicotiana attenuata]